MTCHCNAPAHTGPNPPHLPHLSCCRQSRHTPTSARTPAISIRHVKQCWCVSPAGTRRKHTVMRNKVWRKHSQPLSEQPCMAVATLQVCTYCDRCNALAPCTHTTHPCATPELLSPTVTAPHLDSYPTALRTPAVRRCTHALLSKRVI
jgi:hypothetical protein